MVPVMGRLVAHGTWHIPLREGMQKFSRAPGGQTRGSAEPKLAGYMCPTLKSFVGHGLLRAM